MKIGHEYDRFRNQVKPALESKLEEFIILGYAPITESALWEFLTKKKWRKVKEDIKLFEIVEQIMSVNVGEYMNFATVEAFREAQFQYNPSDLQELFNK